MGPLKTLNALMNLTSAILRPLPTQTPFGSAPFPPVITLPALAK